MQPVSSPLKKSNIIKANDSPLTRTEKRKRMLEMSGNHDEMKSQFERLKEISEGLSAEDTQVRNTKKRKFQPHFPSGSRERQKKYANGVKTHQLIKLLSGHNGLIQLHKNALDEDTRMLREYMRENECAEGLQIRVYTRNRETFRTNYYDILSKIFGFYVPIAQDIGVRLQELLAGATETISCMSPTTFINSVNKIQ